MFAARSITDFPPFGGSFLNFYMYELMAGASCRSTPGSSRPLGGLLTPQAEVIKFPTRHPDAVECSRCGMDFIKTVAQQFMRGERAFLCAVCTAWHTREVSS
jgi:hypothetical protein